METWPVSTAKHAHVTEQFRIGFLPFKIRPATEKGQTRPSSSNYCSLALPLALKMDLQINFLQINLAD